MQKNSNAQQHRRKLQLSHKNENPQMAEAIFKPKLPKSFYITKLRDWAEEIPITGLLLDWETNIVQLIPKMIRRRYQKTFQTLLEEVRTIYTSTMQQFAIESIVVSEEIQVTSHTSTIKQFKKINKRQKAVFLMHRQSLAEIYFLGHSVIRYICSTAHTTLPAIIFNFTVFRTTGIVEITDMQTAISKNIRNGMMKVKYEYHRAVEKVVSSPKSLCDIDDKPLCQFITCLTHIFTQKIIYSMMQSVEHMINVVKSDESCPLVHFELVCDSGQLSVKPSVEEMSEIYQQFIADIESIGQNLLSFRIARCSGMNLCDYINVNVPDWFHEKSRNDICIEVVKLLKPLTEDFTRFNDEFHLICATQTKLDILELVDRNESFEIYCDHVNKFDEYLQKASGIVAFVYYSFGRLDQRKAKNTLMRITTEIIDILVQKLVKYHQEFNQAICKEFEDLETQALNIPNNAKALFELSESMTVALTVTLEKLELKIEQSVQMLVRLLEITTLSAEHMELNRRTINWLSSIKSVFNQSNTLCEAVKSELEDELQRKINILNTQVDEIVPELIILDDMDDAKRVHEYMEYLDVLVRKIDVVSDGIQAVNGEEKLFKFPETLFPKLDEINNVIKPFYSLNRLIFQWRRHNCVWMDGPFEYINAVDVKKLTFFYFDQFTELHRSMKTKIKADMSSNKPFRFSGAIDDPDPMQQPAPLKLGFQALEDVKKFKQFVPMVNCMCNPALASRHWREMSAIFGADLSPNAGTTLRKMISLDLMKDIEKYEAISISADRELALQKQLEAMSKEWDGVSFAIESNTVGKLNFSNFQDIQMRLEEHLVIVQEMKGSYFVKPIVKTVEEFDQSLISARKTIEHWNDLQDEIQLLQPVFSRQNDAEVLAVEKDFYGKVRETVREVSEEIMLKPSFQTIGKSPKYTNRLEEALKMVEKINKGLSTYLDSIRTLTPRFFFISNNEMTGILFDPDAGNRVKMMLQKFFTGIHGIKFNSEREIESIQSDCGEKLKLKARLACLGSDWLTQSVSAVTAAVQEEILFLLRAGKSPLECVDSLEVTRECVVQLLWTANVENCFQLHAAKLTVLLQEKILEITQAVDNLKHQRKKNERATLTHLITTLIHQRDVTAALVEREITFDTDIHWIIQLRYYVVDNYVQVCMGNGLRDYGYEFRASQQPIVNTPMTDRCFRAIFEASQRSLFGSFAGAASSGKTEIIRALSRASGVNLQVINCTDDLTCDQISRRLKGLIGSGCWLCFNDMNNTNIEVLSALAQQIHFITKIMVSGIKEVSFEGTNLILDPRGFIVTTLKPSFSLSPRQNEIPDNLRELFRSIFLAQPDVRKICEVQLLAGGFEDALNLAVKVDNVFKLCLDQLADGNRYNFSTRAVNAVIKTSIALKFEFPEEKEDILILRALVDVTLPMLELRDVMTFEGFLQDSFPLAVLPPPNYSSLLKALDQVAKEDGLQVHPVFRLKIVQILEMMHLKHTLALVGDAYVGKTTLLKALARCLTLLRTQGDPLGVNVVFQAINQKAMHPQNLIGHADQDGRWRDGVFTSLFRDYSRDTTFTRRWIIFDGPVDRIWIENLSTVFDSSKNLLLSSGESIKMSELTSVIFETDKLSDASPAVLSRCGVIFLEPESIGWRPLAAGWIQHQQLLCNYNEFLTNLLNWSMDPVLNFIFTKCHFVISVSEIYLVMSVLRLLGILVKDAFEDADRDHFAVWFQAALLLSIVWAMGNTLSSESCAALDTFCISLWSSDARPDFIKQFDITLPIDSSVLDNIYIFKGVGVWKPWVDALKAENPEPQACGLIGCSVVPTIDVIRLIYFFSKHVKHRVPFILCGESPSGKTTTLQYLLKNKLPRGEYLTSILRFPSGIAAQEVQRLVLSRISRVMHAHYAPAKKKFCVNFVDDFDLTTEDQPSSASELIRQYIDHDHWYDLKNSEKLFIKNVMFLCVTRVEGKNSRICSRFVRHFNLYQLQSPSRDSIFRVFSNTLLHNLKKNLFSADVMGSINSMVNATMQVYFSMREKFKSSPNNRFCQINLHDFARVINGCSLIHRESAETKVTLLRLWVHECLRVFGDRITDNSEGWLISTIREAVVNNFKDSFDGTFDHLPKENDQLTEKSFRSLIFGDFIDGDKVPRRYEEISSRETLKNKITGYLQEFNSCHEKKLEILIMTDVVEHLVRVCRALSTPSASLLMLCRGGSGRRSLAILAAFIQKQKFFELSLSPLYDTTNWRNDLKSVLNTCSTSEASCTFFLPGPRIKDAYLRDIISILATGEVPGLISAEEMQQIIESCRLPAQKGDRNLEIDVEEVVDYFFDQCRQRLHFILYYNVLCKEFQRQMRVFPDLLKTCHVDCFSPWTHEAFVQLGSHFIRDVDISSDNKPRVVVAGKYFHDQAKVLSARFREQFGRETHVSPSAFIHTMQLYVELMRKHQREIAEATRRYQGGLKKLQLAAEQVTHMQTALTALRPQLEWSARQTEDTMQEIESENIVVQNATIQVKRDEESANRTAAIAATLKCECEAELAVAIPILEDAIAALNTLKPADITVVKAMKNPPDTVKLVMAAVCVMLGVSAERVLDPVTGRKSMDFWGPSKRVLGDMNFLQNLKDYDKDNIPPALMQVVKKTYMTDKNFLPHIVTKASSAAEGLCKWVRAMVSYDEVAKIVAPKKEKLAAAEKECNEILAFLDEKRKTLAALNEKLNALKVTLQATLAKKLELEIEVKNCTEKLIKAEGLIASLGGEKMKWTQAADSLKHAYDNLPGDILLCCAVLAHLAPYHLAYRDEYIQSWQGYLDNLGISSSIDFSFIHSLESSITINSWHLCGLPKDRFLLQNAVMLKNSQLWCLFIDPQNQANTWIKEMERKNGLIAVKLTDSNYLQAIEQSVELGNPVLVENIGENLNFLDCVLSQRTLDSDGKLYLEINHKNIALNSNFRLFMTTRLQNPCFHPTVFRRVTVINFFFPDDALQSRLLDIVVSRERPELQEKFDRLVIESAANESALKQEEENILTVLSLSTNNILEDEKALMILDSSKNLSVAIRQKEELVKQAKLEIDEFRKNYNQLTKYCAALCSTLTALAHLNCMYKFSLTWFTQLYVKSILTSSRSRNLEKRIEFLKLSFTRTLHSSVQNALLSRHKLLYSFILCLRILCDNQELSSEEMELFMALPPAKSRQEMSWLSENVWEAIHKLSAVAAFHGLASSLQTAEITWKMYYNSRDVNSKLPEPWERTLTPFQKLILTKIFKPEQTVEKIRQFMSTMTQYFSTDESPVNLAQSYSESSCLVPLIFILPSYLSPRKMIEDFGEKLGYSSKLVTVSLGPESGLQAQLMVSKAQEQGNWVFLQNCHLAPDWMPQLEKIYEGLDTSNTSLGFRLWLSSCPSDLFPVDVLQNAIKITCDSPATIKETLLSSYSSAPMNNSDFFNSCPGNDKIFAKIIYTFCWFHAATRERAKFGLQAWNVSYDFCHEDLVESLWQLQSFLKVTRPTALQEMFLLAEDVNYGTKIVDTLDGRYIEMILKRFCNEKTILESNYSFFEGFTVPNRCEYRDYVAHIDGISCYAPPQLFGADENAGIVRDIGVVNEFFGYISQLKGDSDFQGENEENIEEKIQEIRNKLPVPLDIDQAVLKYPIDFLNPLNCVLIQEIRDYNYVLEIIEHSLGNNEVRIELSRNIVPSAWNFASNYHDRSLVKVLKYLENQFNFFNGWIQLERPVMFDLGAFTYPKRFISTIFTMFARKLSQTVEEIIFTFNVLPGDDKFIEENSTESIYICDLNLVGAKWDFNERKITPSEPKIFSTILPVIQITCGFKSINNDKFYSCPVYKSTAGRDLISYFGESSNFISEIHLPTDLSNSFCLLRGVSIFCHISD